MKRILSCSLALLMLVLSVPIFASCGKSTVDLAGYSIIYVNDEAAYTKRKCTDLISAVRAVAGKKPQSTAVRASEDADGGAQYEILVGKTNRPESKKALSRIDGHGYSVTTEGDKIVLVGTTDLLTAMAVDYFMDNCLSGESEGTVITVVDEIVEEMPMLEITQKTAFVYSSVLNGKDAENIHIGDLKEKISEISSVRGTQMPEVKDTEEKRETEIIVGAAYNRTEALDVFTALDADKYGVVVREKLAIVGGMNRAMINEAKTLFSDLLTASIYQGVDEQGKERTFIALPIGFSEINSAATADYTYDFPRPEGLSLYGTVDVQDGSVEYLYRSSGVSADAYESYCAALVASGYTLYMSHTVEDSIFRTYNNAATGISLNVSFDAFKHAASQGLTHPQAIRVVASRLDKINLLPEEYLTQDLSFQKLQNSSISALRVDYDDPTTTYWGNIYIVTLEDGSFIVLDGGTGSSTDVKRIWECLLDLYKRGHNGKEPTTEQPVEIVAWYLSHPHGDHFVNMRSFINTYCANYRETPVRIKYLLANFTSAEEHHNSNNPASISTINAIKSLSDKVQGGMKYIKLHTGQVFHIANVDFEVMYTHEHLYPTQLHTFNNCSTVIRMTLNHTENGALTGGRETMLWLGDAQEAASRVMRALYGDYLKSDMVQVAHHGYSGCEIALYRLVAPECVWWPTGRSEWKKAYHDSSSTGYKKVSYLINYDIASVKYIILSDDFNYTVSVTATGADYALAKDSPTGVFGAGDAEAAKFASFSQYAGYGFMIKS